MSSTENEAPLADGAKSDDELSLFDLVAFVRRHRVALLGGAIIGGAVGLAVAYTLPAQWEAQVLVRVGQLGGATTPIEQPLRVVERIAQRPFADDVLKRLGAPPDEPNPQAGLFRNGLKVKLEKSDLVGLRVRGGSPDDAARFADAVVAELRDLHAKMAEPTIARWRNEVEEVDVELRRVSSETVRLRSLLESPFRMAKDGPFPAALASYVLMSREVELRAIRERKRALQEQLNPERTYATGPLGRAYVAKQAVFPKKSLFAAVGLVIGLLGGVLLSVLRPGSVRKRRAG